MDYSVMDPDNAAQIVTDGLTVGFDILGDLWIIPAVFVAAAIFGMVYAFMIRQAG